MFVEVILKAPLGRQLTIPSSGVLQSGTRQIVFVSRGNGYLEPRDVQLGPRVGQDFIVSKGLKSGEQIVTSANFLIDSESQLQAALGSFAPPEPANAAGSSGVTPQTDAEFSSDPNPPAKGTNKLRVRLADARGAAITGAEVSVTFFMPAMPAMGMAELRTSTPLADKGSGLYEANAQVQSGGTWQVTIVAKKAGQIVANKQLSVTATGGM
jgi:Cu(I)/Ag(I) efflux system membrane fusion protein/cobalt-zinc-cadmium efflux system membrane fusion protein